ncbi:hypothetical protein DTO169E5_9035 [Paecilomyces variotii]|nr:hypothetical protein DTO169E5_9035 [Paecilomyces variotii]
MSDTQKPVEETPAAAPATETPAEAPATETPAAEAPQETPAEATEAAPAAESTEEAPKEEEAKKEVTPATDGVLGYKAPGLVKSLRFVKRYFYFSEEPVEVKSLSQYLQTEKASVAHPLAAWASQSGKGLLFFAKRAEDKATPAGILSLADVTVSKEGSSEFIIKANGQKHTFQAASAEERDSWIAAVEAKATEAKAEKEAITSSEGYKAELEKLNKGAEPEAAKKDESAPADEDKATKSRSQSRKRASIFGAFLNKKEETAEEKKEEKKEDKAEEAKPAEPAAETTEASAATETPAEAPAAAEATEDKKEEKKAEAPAKNKRTSIFGNFFQKVTSPTTEKSEKEANGTEETTAVSSTAPQLENPVEEANKPAEGETEAPAEGEAAKKDESAPAAEATAEATTSKDKRRTSFFGTFGKNAKKGEASDSEGEAKPKNKLGGLFRKPSKAVKSGKDKEAAPAEPETIPEGEDKPEPISKDAPAEEKPAEEAAKEEEKEKEAVADAPAAANVATTTAPIQAAA